MAGAGRFFQERTTITIKPKPRIRTTGGIMYAARSKPCMVGAASTVGPYFWTKPCSTRLSLSPRETAAMSSLRMPSESGQPTWLHSRRIWLQLQMHIIWWPISLKRVAGSPAPRKAKMAVQMRRVWAALRPGIPRLAKEARRGAPRFEYEFKKRDISLLWPLERVALAQAALGREHGRERGRSEPEPGPFRRA